jgi:glycosyltransferase involved in cell wall biosynthesis
MDNSDVCCMAVTVIIPTKGRPSVVRTAIASALESGRDIEGLEIVVVNDGDKTHIQSIAEGLNSQTVRVVSNTHSPGPSGARNCGVEHTTAQIIFFLDDDDVFTPNYLKSVLSLVASQDNQVGFGHSSFLVGNRVKGIGGATRLIMADRDLQASCSAFSRGFWVQREAFLKVGEIDTALRINEDTDFCLRLVGAGEICLYSAEPGVQIRPIDPVVLGETGSITNRVPAAERAAAFAYILKRHSALLTQHPAFRNMIVRRIIKYLARSGDSNAALAAAREYGVGMLPTSIEIFKGLLSRDGRSGHVPR